jgi:hypothetical protein
MMSGMARSVEARKVLRELDDELASASRRVGKSLVWTATDREVLTLIDGTIDRKVHLTRDYAAAEVNRPGMSGDSISWEGWGYASEFVEEVSAGTA